MREQRLRGSGQRRAVWGIKSGGEKRAHPGVLEEQGGLLALALREGLQQLLVRRGRGRRGGGGVSAPKALDATLMHRTARHIKSSEPGLLCAES
jgi:hypothetical protein